MKRIIKPSHYFTKSICILTTPPLHVEEQEEHKKMFLTRVTSENLANNNQRQLLYVYIDRCSLWHWSCSHTQRSSQGRRKISKDILKLCNERLLNYFLNYIKWKKIIFDALTCQKSRKKLWRWINKRRSRLIGNWNSVLFYFSRKSKSANTVASAVKCLNSDVHGIANNVATMFIF